jgi:eukaryotic-like serine/threonine-protein kinase
MPERIPMHAATPQPERLGQYEILETLAQGHSGWILYKGFDPIFRRHAYLRAIRKSLLDDYGAAMIARLQNDVAAAARLHHPGIVGVYEYGEDSDAAFIASEFVEGSCLKEQSRVSVADAVSLIVQVLSALEFAHNQGVIHREIKPSNLLINDKGQIRIANFGIAELNAGTPAYMSPEQLSGGLADRRSDLFCAGIVLYELLSGVRPFAGPPESLVQRVCKEKERPPSEINPEIPKSFDAVCAKALAKSANERYSTARSFSEAVRTAFESTFASLPSRVVSNNAVLTATLPRPKFEPESKPSLRVRNEANAPAPIAASKWDEANLRMVEKQLAAFVGPLAKIIIKDAAGKASDLPQLYSLAAESLKKPQERQAFLAQMAGASPGSPTPEPPRSPLPGSATPKSPLPVPVEHRGAAEGKTPAQFIPPPPKVEPVVARSAARHEVKPAPGPELNSVAKHEMKPVAKPDIKPIANPPVALPAKPALKAGPPQPPAAPQPKPAAASRIEGLLGKQPPNLAGYLQDGPPKLEEVIHAFVSSVQALIALHATGSKKQALTPQSICFDHLGKASIELLQPTLSSGTSSGAGNPRYAAPELFSEKSAKSDTSMAAAHVYALGIMFYEILLGRKLFVKTFADQRTDLDWLRWHADLESRAPQLKSLLPDHPVALSDLVESMMEKHADKRPSDLESLLSRWRSIAQRANKTIVLDKSSAKAPAAKPAFHGASAPSKKNHLALLAMIIFILALAAGGFFLWQNPDYYRTVIAPRLHLSTD